MPKGLNSLNKRTKDTIIRTLIRLEAKYGENAVRLVVNCFLRRRRERNQALRLKEDLEKELKKLNKKL